MFSGSHSGCVIISILGGSEAGYDSGRSKIALMGGRYRSCSGGEEANWSVNGERGMTGKTREAEKGESRVISSG